MPGGDRTGPVGMGPRTGRAAGYCSGFEVPGFVTPMPERGYGGRGGWGRGNAGWCGWSQGGSGRGGRGRRHRFYAMGVPGWQRAAGVWPAWGAGIPDSPFVPFSPTVKSKSSRGRPTRCSGVSELTKTPKELCTR